MSRNLLRKTKRENVQTLLYQTLNFARVVVDTDPYKGSRIVFYKFTMSHGRTMTAPTVAVYIRAEGSFPRPRALVPELLRYPSAFPWGKGDHVVVDEGNL